MQPTNPSSNARVKTYFQFDPLELIDDIVCATSQYVNDGIESLYALFAQLDMSENIKNEFITKLSQKIQESLNKNSDLFELYLMRNIFVIPIDVDLASALDIEENKNIEDNNNFIVENEDFDSEIIALYDKINELKTEHSFLIESIKRNKINLYISDRIIERIPDFQEIIGMYNSIPNEKITQLNLLSQEISSLLNNFKNDDNLIEKNKFNEKSFVFDE